MKTGKITSFFPGKKSKMKKSPTLSYNLPYKNHEKKSSYEVEVLLLPNGRASCREEGFLYGL